MEVIYIGNYDGCLVTTKQGNIEVRKGESINLEGVQLSYALSHGFIEKYLYDEEKLITGTLVGIDDYAKSGFKTVKERNE